MSVVFVTLDYFRGNTEAMALLHAAFDRVIVATDRARALDELAPFMEDCDALIVGVRERITEEFLKRCPRLKAIGTLSVGLDHVDVKSVEARNIELFTTEGLRDGHAVAEHALMMMLCLLKRTFQAHEAAVNGLDRKGVPGFTRELRGKRIGILGAGGPGYR